MWETPLTGKILADALLRYNFLDAGNSTEQENIGRYLTSDRILDVGDSTDWENVGR